MKMTSKLMTIVAASVALTACATAQMHTEAQLNEIATGCGLSYGEVVQEAEEKRLLFLYRIKPAAAQRHCVYLWAKRNHLTLVIINAVNDPIGEGPKS
jgi:hypothetical protein